MPCDTDSSDPNHSREIDLTPTIICQDLMRPNIHMAEALARDL